MRFYNGSKNSAITATTALVIMTITKATIIIKNYNYHKHHKCYSISQVIVTTSFIRPIRHITALEAMTNIRSIKAMKVIKTMNVITAISTTKAIITTITIIAKRAIIVIIVSHKSYNSSKKLLIIQGFQRSVDLHIETPKSQINTSIS